MDLRTPRYVAVVSGIAAWHISGVAVGLALGALGLGLIELSAAVVVLGLIGHRMLCGNVLEFSTLGLTRGFLLDGKFRGRTTVMAWRSIVSVHTDWRRPGDDTALSTTIRDGDGRVIHFSTAMGLRNYRRCLAAVVERAPSTAPSGLTAAIVAAGPERRREQVSAAVTAAGLALVLIALVGLHYLFAQGPSSLQRYLDRAASEGPGEIPAR
jgi:hypothetical protein